MIPDGDVAALKSAINIANSNGEDDTIELAVNGTYTVTTVDNYYVNALPALVGDGGHSLTIHGNGATLQRSADYTTPPLRFFSLSADATLIIDALTMFGAYSNGDTSTGCGAAIYSHGGTVTIANSTFRANRARLGGAIYNDGEDDATSLTLTNCVLENNSATVGGAICSSSPSPSITVAIDQCTFSGNSATGTGVYSGGGAITTDGSGASVNVTIDHSTFNHNSAFSMSGGAICNRGGNIVVTESSFLQNYALEGGVAYNNGATGATLSLSHCTVSGNSTSAIVNHGNRGNAVAVIRDSTFVENYNPYDGGAIWNGGDYGTATTWIENSIFIRNASNRGGAI